MKRKRIIYGKWLMLAFFILAAGGFCSCGSREETVSLLQEDMEESSTCVPESESDRTEEQTGTADAVSEMSPETAAEPERCFVHVCGEVMKPGVYELSEGQRIYEAVEAAGGFTEQAASAWLNLAEPVCDGMKLEVPSKEQAAQLAAKYGVGIGPDGSSGLGSLGLTGGIGGSLSEAEVSSGGKVNINTATKEELMTLWGIGEARAEDIIRYRESHGSFQRIEDIMKVSGIKDAAFEKIKGNITV